MTWRCRLFGHVPIIQRRLLRCVCSRCGQELSAITLEPHLRIIHPRPDDRFRLKEEARHDRT
jgi:hypothetical protein